MSLRMMVNEPARVVHGRKKPPRLGQNFLTDQSAATRIIDTLGDISSAVVMEIGPGRGILTDILVPRTVADRIAANPGSPDYRLLTVTSQFYTNVVNVFALPPEALSPPAAVHSSVLRMKVAPKAAQLGVKAQKFISFLRLSFGQK